MSKILTAPRVTLLAITSLIVMFSLFMFAEAPLTHALNFAAASRLAGISQPEPACRAADFSGIGPSTPLQSFDNRGVNGYTYADALAILCAMEMHDGAGRKIYLKRHFPLDMAFLVFYALGIAALWLFLIDALGWQSNVLRVLALVPIVVAALDFAENLIIRSLVLKGPPPDPATVAMASSVTQAKAWACALLLAILPLLFWYLIRASFHAGRAGHTQFRWNSR